MGGAAEVLECSPREYTERARTCKDYSKDNMALNDSPGETVSRKTQ